MAMSEFVKKMVEQIENKGNGSDQGQPVLESNSDAAAPTDPNAAQAPDPNAAQAPNPNAAQVTDPNAAQAPDPNAGPQSSPGTQSGSGSQNASSTQEPPSKFGKTFVDRAQYPDRNKFIQKEYVDTYAAERDYDKELANPNSTDEDKEAKLSAIESAAKSPYAAPAPLPEKADDTVSADMQSGLTDAMLKTDKEDNSASDETPKQADISSIVTDSGIITGMADTYNDEVQRRNDAASGKTGEKHSNNLTIASDAFNLAESIASLTGSLLSEAETEENVTKVLGKSLGTVGSILGMSSHADRVRRQNQAIGKLKGNVNDNAQTKDEKRKSKLSKDYIRAAKAKRFGSGFETGAGVANVISSGFELAGSSISAAGGNKTLSTILGLASTLVGMFSKGLSFMGSFLESKQKKKNKDEIVDEYIKAKIKNVQQHGTTQQEGEDLSDNEKQNIVIARLGVKVEDFADKNVREQSKDEIFKRIGLKRVKQAKQDKEFLKTIGLEESASDDAILEALGYAD